MVVQQARIGFGDPRKVWRAEERAKIDMARLHGSSGEIADRSPAPQLWWRGQLAFLFVVILVFGAGFLLFLTPGVDAKSEFLSGFATRYPGAANSPLNSCLLCHTDPNPSGSNKARNAYGRDWAEVGDKSYGPIENRDSDGDGFTNLQEIQAQSFPGNGQSTPNTVTTTTTTAPGTPPNGQALFAARCAACHGANGGNLSGTSLPRTTFINITLNGQGNMPAQTGISSAEVGAIWDYVTGATPTTTTTTLPGATTTTTQAVSGATVWAQNCAVCHGQSGGDVVPTNLSKSQLVSIVNTGRGSMPGFASLGSAQVNNVADYLLSLSVPTTTVPGATTTTTAPRSGSVVFAASCQLCHGSDGGDLRGHSKSLSQIIDVVSTGQGSMSGFAGRLSSAEISNVSQFVQSVGTGVTTTTAAPGTASGATIYGQNCTLCHGDAGGDLRGHTLSLSTISGVVTNGQGSMSGFAGRLAPIDITSVAEYVFSVGVSGGVTTTTAAPGSAPSGSNLYMQNCSGCHGLHGEGGPGGVVAGTALSRAEIISLTTNGKGSMPAYGGRLTGEEIAAIADHVRGFGASAASGPSAASTATTGAELSIPPEYAEGHALYGWFCAACHGANGEGGLGGQVAGIGITAAELDEIIRNGVGSMPGFADQMSDEEITVLVAFTEALASGQEFSAADETKTTEATSDGDSGPQALGASQPNRSSGNSPVPVIVVSLFAGLVAAGAAVLWARVGRNLTR